MISSYAEYSRKNPQKMFELVEEKTIKNVRLVLEEAKEEKLSPRDAALNISQNRVRKAMERRKMSKM